MPTGSTRYPAFCQALGSTPALFHRTLRLFDCLAAGVVVANRHGDLLYWNPAAIRLHGYQSELEVQHPLEDFRHKFEISRGDQVLPLEQWPMARLIRGEAMHSEELHVQRLDTRQCWILCYDGEILTTEDDDSESLFVLTIHDVTAEREAQAQLRQTAELFRAVAECSEDAVFIKDLTGRYLHFNPAAGRFVGKPPHEVVGRDDAHLFDAEGLEAVRRHDRAVMDSGQTTIFEEVLVTNGVRRVYQASKAPYRDLQGQVVGLVGISRDVTEAKRFEQELIAERERLERLARVAPGALHTYHTRANGEHRFVYTTPALEELYGVPRELLEADANNAFRRIHPDDLPRIHASVALAAQNLEEWSCEFRILHPERGEIWMQGRSCPVADGEGGLYWHGIIIDITSHKETAAALKAERDRFQFIVDSVPGAIYSFCMRPDGSTYFPYASPVLEEIFGVPRDRLAIDATPIFQTVSPEALPELLKSIERSRQTLEPWSAQIPYLHPQRGACWTDGHSVPSRLPDGSTIWHGYLWDSTERRSLEQQFWQAQKMEAVGRLAGGVAHDFNNLLTVINGYADMMIQETGMENPLYSGLLQIREAGERSARLTGQLLAFSRQALIEPKNFDANKAIKESQKMLRRLIGEYVEFQVNLSPRPLPVFLDQGQFEQLVLNLIVNARDAMPVGGKLTLSTEQASGELLLSIRDSGCGMPADILNRIFEPFFTTKGIGKGTGLGLAVVHGVVTRGGGRVEVESEPGEGTVFRVFFPLAPQSGEQPRQGDPDALRGTETILIVEDEPAVRRVLVKGLEMFGYRVLVADSGQSALDLCDQSRERIHLMLSDVVMPGLSGPEAARLILQSRPELKVLFMTGYTEDDRIPPDILHKPFSARTAAEKIRAMLDNTP